MTSIYERQIGSIGARLRALLLPNPELIITAATEPEQVRERIASVQEADRSRLGYNCSATESAFVVERAHAEIDRRLATRRGRKFGVSDKQMRYVATETFLRTAGLVEWKAAATSIVGALGVAGVLVCFVLMAFGAVEGLWDLERMPGVDVDKLDFLSKTAALSAVVYAVVVAVFCVVIDLVWRAAGVRRRGAAAIVDRVAVMAVWVLGAAVVGLSLYFVGVAAAFTLM